MIGNRWKPDGPPRLWRVFLSIVALLTVVLTTQHYASASAQQPEISGEPIAYDHLANQETDPFLFSGRLMDKDHPRWHQFRRALRGFPGVQDCLVEEEQGKAEPNLLLIDWHQTGLGRGAQVCVFLIARSLGSIERHQQWLTFHEFRVLDLMQIFPPDYIPPFETKPVSILSGSWTTEQYRAKNPSWFANLTGLETVQGYSVIIRYSDQQLVVGVSASSRSK